MITLLMLCASLGLAQAPDAVSGATAQKPPGPPDRLYVSAKLGWPQPVGVHALMSLADEQGPRWDLDLLVEPSSYQQSLSAAVGFRPFHNALALNARVRWLQRHPPWARGYIFAVDNAITLSPEVHGRWTLGAEDKLLISAGLGGLFSPWGRAAMPPMFTIDLGVGWQVMRR